MSWSRQISPQDKHLLYAAICQGDISLENWVRWKKIGNIADLNTAAYRLLPMVYQNLLAHHFEDELTKILKGVYKRAWVENQVLFQTILPIEKAFEEHNIDYCWLGEAAMSKGLYGTEWIRPIAYVVFYISKVDRSKAFFVLKELNWKRAKLFQIRSILQQTDVYKFKSFSFQLKWNLPQSSQLVWNSKVLDTASQLTYLLKTKSSYRTINQLVLLADLFHLTQLDADHPYQKNRTIQYLNMINSQAISID